MTKLSVRDIDLKEKRVLMRVDFNVSLDKQTGDITDDTRIKAALPTIEYVLKHGASLVLMSHLGRPKGNVVAGLKMDKVGQRLSLLLGKPVLKLDECVGAQVENVVRNLVPGQVVLLENTRFYPEETANDAVFARKLSRLGDVFVNDAFGTAHRAHASTVGVASYLPAVAGLLMARELDVLGAILSNPEQPFIAILGGAKVSDKIGVLSTLVDKCRYILIGGGMAYTFLKADGIDIGSSLVEEDKLAEAAMIRKQAGSRGCEIVLPVDHVVATEPSTSATSITIDDLQIPAGLMGLDIGPKTVQRFIDLINVARTVFWNGPLGYFEVSAFSIGTREIARTLAISSATVVVGGGDSIAALKSENMLDKMAHVSTGGGASLEFLEGKELPGVVILKDKV